MVVTSTIFPTIKIYEFDINKTKFIFLDRSDKATCT